MTYAVVAVVAAAAAYFAVVAVWHYYYVACYFCQYSDYDYYAELALANDYVVHLLP